MTGTWHGTGLFSQEAFSHSKLTFHVAHLIQNGFNWHLPTRRHRGKERPCKTALQLQLAQSVRQRQLLPRPIRTLPYHFSATALWHAPVCYKAVAMCL